MNPPLRRTVPFGVADSYCCVRRLTPGDFYSQLPDPRSGQGSKSALPPQAHNVQHTQCVGDDDHPPPPELQKTAGRVSLKAQRIHMKFRDIGNVPEAVPHNKRHSNLCWSKQLSRPNIDNDYQRSTYKVMLVRLHGLQSRDNEEAIKFGTLSFLTCTLPYFKIMSDDNRCHNQFSMKIL